MALAMKTEPLEPTCASPHSSTLLGVTLLADHQDVMAALRTAILLARNFKSSLYVDLPDRTTVPIDFSGETSPAPQLADLLGQIEAKLRDINALPRTGFTVQFDFAAASFLSAGTMSIRIRCDGAD